MNKSLGEVKGHLFFLSASSFLHAGVHFGGKLGRAVLG